MKLRATAKIKITITPEIVHTIKVYGKGLQFCVNIAWKNKIQNNIKLHNLVYKHLRNKYKLPAQLAIACIKQASGLVKKANSKPIIKKIAVGYNFPRSANIKKDILVIRTIDKRQEFKLKIPECYNEYFSTWNLNESLLKIDNKGRAFFLFVFSKEIKIPNNPISSTKILGIDLGINKIAVTSDRNFFKSSKVKQIKNKFHYLRKKLQAKGTRSSKRLLNKLAGRETRFMAWYNHSISKRIISNLNPGDVIVMENLKGIRKNKGRRINRWLHNWSFYQLQRFIEYKTLRKRISVIKINPLNTSKKCSKCNSMNTKRNSGFFECLDCNYNLDADLNATYNIAKLYRRNLGKAAITQPYSRSDDVEDSLRIIDTELMAKSLV